MIRQVIYRILKRRHFWRYASFDEVAELYVSRMLTTFALRFVMVFASVYLYKLEYGIVTIAMFWAYYYGLKAIFAWPSAKIAARFGPKHGLLVANILFVPAMLLLFSVDKFGLPVLLLWGVLQAFAGTLNNLCYLVDFSKVKHSEHAGKEIGYMSIIEKVAAGVSPLLGGLAASLIHPSAAILLAALFFLLSVVPIMHTAEQTRLRQKLTFKGFPWRLTSKGFVAQGAVGFDFFMTTTAWSLFITLIIFASDGQEIYAKLGALTSITLAVAMVSSYIFGRLIDRKQGLLLLQVMAILNAATHVFRPTVNTPIGVIANNAVNDIATTGYAMAFSRGMFDTADLSGFRIMYLFMMEIMADLGACLAALLLGALFMVFQDGMAMNVYFIVGGLMTLFIMTPRFAMYKK
ncbi:MAG TPA: MFS transporter [Candidatus Saccharimonadales bacterium]